MILFDNDAAVWKSAVHGYFSRINSIVANNFSTGAIILLLLQVIVIV